VYLKKEKLEVEQMEIEEVEQNTNLKPMKRTRPIKTVKYLKIYDRKNEPILPEPFVGQSRPRKNKKWRMTLKKYSLSR